MNEKGCPLVVSISRQRGCGGAYLGQEVARSLGIRYLDRALVAEIAKQLELPEDMVEQNDERLATFWESVTAALNRSNPWLYNAPPIQPPSEQVRHLESEAILRIAYEQPAVIVGRGARWLLRDHPRHVSVLLHAPKSFRIARLMEIYRMSEGEAAQVIDDTDGARSRYIEAFSGADPLDATQYHLAIDTCALGLTKAIDLVLHYIRSRFDDI